MVGDARLELVAAAIDLDAGVVDRRDQLAIDADLDAARRFRDVHLDDRHLGRERERVALRLVLVRRQVVSAAATCALRNQNSDVA